MEVRKNLKHWLQLLLAAIIPVMITFAFMKLVSLNLSYAFIISVVSLFVSAYWQLNNPINKVVKIIALIMPLSLIYYFLLLPEIPGLWIAIPLFLLVASLVFFVNKLYSVTVSAILTIIIGLFVVPKIVSNNLTNITTEKSPSFEIENLLNNTAITNESLKGKVVVLDFFGTWCAPCIKEMAELKTIKEELNSEHVEFIIACTQMAGDTPEKAKKFYDNRNLPFVLAFDYDSKTHKSFKFSGVPGLVILDKQGNVRLKHEGYNEAENLKETLIPFLNQLINE